MKNDLHLLHSWLTDPREFFARLFGRLAVLSKRTQRLVAAFTYLIPLATATCLAVILLKNAIVVILQRFVPMALAPVVYLLLSLLVVLSMRGYHQTLLAAKRLPRRNGRLSRFLPAAIPTLEIARNNLCMLPALVVTSCMALTYTGFSWNVYHFGAYLLFMFCLGLAWSGWMIGNSSAALPAIEARAASKDPVKETNKEVKRVLLTTLIATLLLGLAIDALLPLLVGAERMPFFFKLAYLLMHGN